MMFGFWADAFPPLDSVRGFLGWWSRSALRFFHDPLPALPVPSAVSLAALPFFLPVPALLLCGCASRRNRPAAAATGLSLLLLALASSLRKWPVLTGSDSVIVSRHLLFLLPVAFFFLAHGLEFVARRSGRLAVAVAIAGTLFVAVRLLQLDERHYSSSWHDAVRELTVRASGDDPVLLGRFHSYPAWAYEPGWVANNRDRIYIVPEDRPDALADRLDALAHDPPPNGFWLLWADRGKEGKLVPALCRKHLEGFRADFSKKTPAGILQHFRPRPKETPPD